MRLIYCRGHADLHLSLSLGLSSARGSNKSSTVLKAIDSEMVWGNYQTGWLRMLPVKKEEKEKTKIKEWTNKGSEARLLRLLELSFGKGGEIPSLNSGRRYSNQKEEGNSAIRKKKWSILTIASSAYIRALKSWFNCLHPEVVGSRQEYHHRTSLILFFYLYILCFLVVKSKGEKNKPIK